MNEPDGSVLTSGTTIIRLISQISLDFVHTKRFRFWQNMKRITIRAVRHCKLLRGHSVLGLYTRRRSLLS